MLDVGWRLQHAAPLLDRTERRGFLLGARLRSAGFNPFLDKWHLIPGEPFQPGLAEALDASACVAIFLGQSGSGPWHNQEMQYALNRAVRTRNDYRVIPVVLPGSDPSQIDGFLGLRTWVDFRPGLDDELAFRRLVAGIKGVAPDSAEGLLELPDDPRPYRGVEHFEQAQHAIYFGRGIEIQRLTARLEIDHFVAVVGGSGSGKSSLARAGLCTDAAERAMPGIRDWHRIVFMPRKDPLLQLAANLVAHVPESDRPALVREFTNGFTARAGGLITALSTLFPNRDRPVLIWVGDDPVEFQLVLDRFSGPGARLISLSSNPEDLSAVSRSDKTAEVAHEALIDHWGRLARWLDDGRDDVRLDRRLTESARRWEDEAKKRNGKPHGLLWRPPELDLDREFVMRARASVSDLQIRFLECSRRAENAGRLRLWFSVLGSLFTLIALGSAYLIAMVEPDVWERVPQPHVFEAWGLKPILPVHDMAINRKDPSVILYLGRNAAWDSEKFSITTNRQPPEFSARVAAKLKAADPINPVARVKFEILGEEGNVRGKGTMEITAALDQTGQVRFFRSLRFEGRTTEESGAVAKATVTPFTLLDRDEDVFDLGEYAEYLASNELLVADDEIRGTIHDLVAGTTHKVAYEMDDKLADAETSPKGYWGSE
jgi:TIR domain